MEGSSMRHAVDHAEKDAGDHAHASDRQFLIAAGRLRAGRSYATNAKALGAAEGFLRINCIDRSTVGAESCRVNG